jgi:hypothetical protein
VIVHPAPSVSTVDNAESNGQAEEEPPTINLDEVQEENTKDTGQEKNTGRETPRMFDKKKSAGVCLVCFLCMGDIGEGVFYILFMAG